MDVNLKFFMLILKLDAYLIYFLALLSMSWSLSFTFPCLCATPLVCLTPVPSSLLPQDSEGGRVWLGPRRQVRSLAHYLSCFLLLFLFPSKCHVLLCLTPGGLHPPGTHWVMNPKQLEGERLQWIGGLNLWERTLMLTQASIFHWKICGLNWIFWPCLTFHEVQSRFTSCCVCADPWSDSPNPISADLQSVGPNTVFQSDTVWQTSRAANYLSS